MRFQGKQIELVLTISVMCFLKPDNDVNFIMMQFCFLCSNVRYGDAAEKNISGT